MDKNYFNFYNANNIFKYNFKKATDIKNDCIYILDTNILLAPYDLSGKRLDSIIKIYEKLISENRLFLPSTVVKEFAKNRPIKLCHLYQSLLDYKSKIYLNTLPSLNILKDDDIYKTLIKLNKDINDQLNLYSNEVGKLIEKIKNYNWDDPISIHYSRLFTEKSIINVDINYEELSKQWSNRLKEDIPPGFKDKHKNNKGIGDFLIWSEILLFAKEKNKDVIYVTNELKNDWFHNSNKQPLYPRYELIYEFKDFTDGKDIDILSFSEFLELNNENQESVNEVKQLELEKTSSNLPRFKINVNPLNNIKHNANVKEISYIMCSKCHHFIKLEKDINWCPYCGNFID